MPGDCSPSRSVVSKISTRLGSSGEVMSLLGLETRCFCLGAGSRLRAAAGALFPPKGEEKKKLEIEAECHRAPSLPSRTRPPRRCHDCAADERSAADQKRPTDAVAVDLADPARVRRVGADLRRSQGEANPVDRARAAVVADRDRRVRAERRRRQGRARQPRGRRADRRLGRRDRDVVHDSRRVPAADREPAAAGDRARPRCS